MILGWISVLEHLPETNGKVQVNEVIARFMGLPPQNEDGTGYVHEDEDGLTWGYSAEELQYDKRWSWLMPVVKKIRDLLHDNVLYEKAKNHWDFICTALSTAEIGAVYIAVRQFIHWYNSTQNKEQS